MPTNTTYADMATNRIGVIDPKLRSDVSDLIDIQRKHLMDYKYNAIIKVAKEDQELANDQYNLDIYEKGYVKTDGSAEDPTRTDISGYVVHVGDFYHVGEQVLVHLLPNHTALILHEQPVRLITIQDEGPFGEDDFETNQYWGVTSFIGSTDTDDTTDPAITAYPAESKLYRVIAVTNLCEDLLGSHNLPMGTIASLKFDYDLSEPTPQKRWIIEAAPTCDLWGTLKYEWTAGSTTVEVVPCKGPNDPTAIDATKSVTVQLSYPFFQAVGGYVSPRPVTHCGFFVDEILGYKWTGAMDSDNKPIYVAIHNPIPIPAVQYQAIYNLSSDNNAPNCNWDFLRAV